MNTRHPWLDDVVDDLRSYGVALAADDVGALHAGAFDRGVSPAPGSRASSGDRA